MKNLMMTVALVFGFSVMSVAQDTPKSNTLHFDAEVETELNQGKLAPQFKGYLTYGGKTKLGAYCWVQVTRSWRQAYCGPTFQLKSWIQVGAAVGVQSGSQRFQAGAFVWLGHSIKGKFVQNLLVVEKAGAWHRNVTTVSVNNKVDLSFVEQRYRGVGPRLDYKLTNKLSVGAELKSAKKPTLAFGFKYKF